MSQQLIANPGRGQQVAVIEGFIDPATGKELEVYYSPGEPYEVVLERARETVDRITNLQAAQRGEMPGISAAPGMLDRAAQFGTEMLPDAAAAASMLIKSNPVGAIMSVLLGSAGELARSQMMGQDFDPVNAAAAGVPGPAVGRTLRALPGERMLASTFKSPASVEQKFPDVDILKEITDRRLRPDQESIERLLKERATVKGEREALAGAHDVTKFPMLDELLTFRQRLEPLAKLGEADLSSIDDLIMRVLAHPQSKGPILLGPAGRGMQPLGAGARRDLPGSVVHDIKVGGQMSASSAFDAKRAGRMGGDNPERLRALSQGADKALHQIPGMEALDKQLKGVKAALPAVRAAERAERTRPPLAIGQRFGVGLPFALGALAGVPTYLATGDPRAGMAAGSALTPLSIPLAMLAGSPKTRANFGYMLNATAAAGGPLEAAIRAILAGQEPLVGELLEQEY